MPVVLDNGEEGADCMVDLSAGSGSDLVIRQVLNRSVNWVMRAISRPS